MKKNRVFALITVLLGSLLMGCASGGKKTDVIRQESTAAAQTDYPDEDEMTITWALFDMNVDCSGMQNELNQTLKEKGIPYKIQFENISVPFETYKDYVNSYVETVKNSRYDIISTGSAQQCYDPYKMMCEKGMLLSWNDFLQEDTGTALKNAYPPAVWEAISYKGDIYGLLSPIPYFNYYLVFNLDYAEKYDIDVEAITWGNLESALQKAMNGEKEEHHEAFAALAGKPEVLLRDYEATMCELILIDMSQGVPRAENALYNQEWLEVSRQINDWKNQGLIPEDQIPAWESLETGDFLATGIYSYSEEAAQQQCRAGGVSEKVRLKAVKIPEFRQSFCGKGSKAAVNAESRQSEAAMEVLAAIYSDKTLSDALVYGKEGVNYQIQNGRAIYLDLGVPEARNIQYQLGNSFLTMPGILDSLSKEEELWNTAEETRSMLAGFSFELGEKLDKVSQIKTYFTEECGWGIYGEGEAWNVDLEEKRRKTEQLGINEIIEEMNSQLEKWEN